MKHTKRTVVFLVAMIVVCIVCISLTACNKSYKYDPEQRPFSMSILTPDGVFNPFFSSSANDSQILSLTQIAMLNTDPNGNIVVGDNEPTVVKDYTAVTDSNEDITTYEFLIKNGIKWSNGSDLTIKDVLFNLYVYLDPVYTGSATIYSTDIVGLQQYRQQDWNAGSSTGSSSFEAGFVADANSRIDKDIEYVKWRSLYTASSDRPTRNPLSSEEAEDAAILDFAFIAKTFYEELKSDWNAINKEDYKDWNFTEKWQIFLMNDNGDNNFLLRESGPESSFKKDEVGNYQLDEEYAENYYNANIGPYLVTKGLAELNNGEYVLKGSDEEFMESVDKAIGEFCVKLVFEGYFTRYFPMSVVERTESRITFEDDEKADVELALEGVLPSNFEIVAKYWATATTVLDKFTAEAKTEYFATHDRAVLTIPGITTRTESREFNGKTLTESYDVLTIKINGVDPKAIYNFGFIVAPMYYYSSTNWNGTNYIEEFNYEEGKVGLEFGNSFFMTEVINDPNKIGLPVGAGPYMASSENGGVGTSDTFFNNNMIYYERNPYFYTTGAGIENANIKYVRYKVVESDQIINALINGDIDYGDPSAKAENETQLKQSGLITNKTNTNGYGYVGINPRFVPDVNVRRAIMKALNAAQLKDDYYKGGFCDLIYRPMTNESWAYPKDATVYTSMSTGGIGIPNTSYQFDDLDGQEIEELIKAAGYEKNSNGVYQKYIPKFGYDVLNYKFTIAGGSTDHPAYKMFLDAAELLNSVGFDVKVVTSQQALSDLTSGKLAVWAAAWTSTIDPDMFQVYHMDSLASSTKNWGYPQILGNTNIDAWGDELEIVVQLSQVIDEARSTIVQSERKELYSVALDLVMELAVEFPSYQRRDLTAYQGGMLDPSSVPADKDITAYSGVLARIWEIDYIKQ